MLIRSYTGRHYGWALMILNHSEWRGKMCHFWFCWVLPFLQLTRARGMIGYERKERERLWKAASLAWPPHSLLHIIRLLIKFHSYSGGQADQALGLQLKEPSRYSPHIMISSKLRWAERLTYSLMHNYLQLNKQELASVATTHRIAP